MDDSLHDKRWGIDDGARAALLLERARVCLAEGDPEGAVVYAEELLDEYPGDVDALLLVADAAPRYGHGEVGLLAARAARRLGREPGAVEAAALLAACLVDEALEATTTLLSASPADARAWAVRAQALEVLGRFDEADAALARAHGLRPDYYPRPVELREAEWDEALRQAWSALSADDRAAAAAWRLEMREAPTLEELRSVEPHAPPATFALLVPSEGALVLRAYRRSLSRGAADANEVVARLADAIRYEIEIRPP